MQDAQAHAAGGQPGAVLGGGQEAGGSAAEGLDSDVRVPQDHDLGAVAALVGAGEGGQEPGGGGGAVLVVVHDDQAGHGRGHGDAVGVPGGQGLGGAVLEAGGVHAAGVRAALGSGTALRVPGAQERGGRSPQGDVEGAAEVGEVVGGDAELPGAGEEVAQLCAEGARGDGLGRQAGPLLGADEPGQRGVLLSAGEQDRGGQWVGALGEGGGEDGQGEGGGCADADHSPALSAKQRGGALAQAVRADAGGGQEDGVTPLPDGACEHPQGEARLAGARCAEHNDVVPAGGCLEDGAGGLVRLGQGLGRGGGQEAQRRGAHGTGSAGRALSAASTRGGLLDPHGPISPRPTDMNRHPYGLRGGVGIRSAGQSPAPSGAGRPQALPPDPMPAPRIGPPPRP